MMGKFEYKVLPAPRRAKRAKGVKGEPARFAYALTELMNLEAAEGWEYFKSEALPMDTKTGMFKGAVETFQTVLIFRRSIEPEDQGGIVSVTPAREPQRVAEAEAPENAEKSNISEIEDDLRDPPLRATDPDEALSYTRIDDTLRAERRTLEFDEQDIDPLKTLVQDHRGKNSD